MAGDRQSVANPTETVASVSFETDARVVRIAWADGHISRFPFIWLRHQRFFPAMGRPDQPAEAPFLLPEDPEAPRVGEVSLRDGRLEIDWAHDGTRSLHELAWLRRNCISEAGRAARRPPVMLWDGAAAAAFPWFAAADLEAPAGRLAVFERLLVYGLVLIRDCPVEPGWLLEGAELFGPIRRTHHGELFDIRSTPHDKRGTGRNIGATAANVQAPHTDESFRHSQIGLNFFHCLKAHPKGDGRSIFVDGFRVAEALRCKDPAAFALLSRVSLQFTAERNPEERFRSKRRMIATDADGVVRGIAVSDRTFPPLNLPEAEIEPAYRSLRAFSRELADPAYAFERLLRPGDCVVFDNHRVLHARTAFDPAVGERHIQQVSVDREEFHNRLRQLAERQGRPDLANLDSDAGAMSQP